MITTSSFLTEQTWLKISDSGCDKRHRNCGGVLPEWHTPMLCLIIAYDNSIPSKTPCCHLANTDNNARVMGAVSVNHVVIRLSATFHFSFLFSFACLDENTNWRRLFLQVEGTASFTFGFVDWIVCRCPSGTTQNVIWAWMEVASLLGGGVLWN